MTAYPTQYGFYFASDTRAIPAVTPFDELPLEVWLDPEAQRGLRPSRACADRWLWFRDSRIPELTVFVAHIPPHPSNRQDSHYLGLLQAAKRENPARIDQYRREYMDAAQWEKTRYGNVAAHVRDARIHL